MSAVQKLELPLKDVRVIFYHKTPASGKTCFMKHASGEVCSFEKLPGLSQIVDPGDNSYIEKDIIIHPNLILQYASTVMNIEQDNMEIISDYQQKIDTPGNCLSIYLARFTTIDPPLSAVKSIGASFISLTEARGLSDVELELLRRAYTVIMED